VTGLFPDVVASVPHDHLDRHYTPQALADAVVLRLANVVRGSGVIEPSCGGGAFVRALHRAGAATVVGVDADPEAAGLRVADIASPTSLELAAGLIGWGAAAVVGNPPFGGPPDYLGLQHALIARRLAPVVALILPWSWLGLPTAVGVLRGDLPDEVWPIHPRPWGDSLRESAVWVWRTSPGGERLTTIGRPVEWRRS
jgi:hypothetical protein